jgi:tetratricopeptide (TPR) repeat protein
VQPVNPAKKKWGGTRKPGTGSRLVETADASNIALLQEKIDAIKKELREKSPLLQLWGTLADLYAARLDITTRMPGTSDAVNDSAKEDPVDESMAEYLAGYKAYQDGSAADAEAHFLASIEHLDRNVLARVNLGNLYFVNGDQDKAKAAFTAALKFCEGDALSEMLTNLGMNALKQGSIDAARGYLEDAIKENPSNAFALNNMGLIFEDQGDMASATSWFTRAVKANGLDEELWYNLGNVLGKAGKKAERLYCFMKAEKLGFTELDELISDLVAQGIAPVDPVGTASTTRAAGASDPTSQA